MSNNNLMKVGNKGVQLQTINDMYRMADMVQQSGMAPSTLDTPQKICVALQYGAEVGLSPMTSLNSICVVSGKPTLYGDAALAQVKQSGLSEYVKEYIEGEGDNMTAVCESLRKGEKEPVKTRFSVEDAKQAKLWMKKSYRGKDTPWVTHPKRMLKYKARAFNLRDNFPDVLMGLHITEEMVGEEDMHSSASSIQQPECNTPSRNERKKVDATEVMDEQPAADMDVDVEAAGNFEDYSQEVGDENR